MEILHNNTQYTFIDGLFYRETDDTFEKVNDDMYEVLSSYLPSQTNIIQHDISETKNDNNKFILKIHVDKNKRSSYACVSQNISSILSCDMNFSLKITSRNNINSLICLVSDFNAPKDTIIISQLDADNFNIKENDIVEVEQIVLKQIKMISCEISKEIKDFHPILEAKLNNLYCVYKDYEMKIKIFELTLYIKIKKIYDEDNNELEYGQLKKSYDTEISYSTTFI